MTHNWLKIDKDKLPKGTVVASDMNMDRPLKEIGEIYFDFQNNTANVITSDRRCYNVTHYLPLPKDEEREG